MRSWICERLTVLGRFQKIPFTWYWNHTALRRSRRLESFPNGKMIIWTQLKKPKNPKQNKKKTNCEAPASLWEWFLCSRHHLKHLDRLGERAEQHPDEIKQITCGTNCVGSGAVVSQMQALFVRMIDKALQRQECEVRKKKITFRLKIPSEPWQKKAARVLQVFPVTAAFLWAKCAYAPAKPLMKYQSGLLKVKCWLWSAVPTQIGPPRTCFEVSD